MQKKEAASLSFEKDRGKSGRVTGGNDYSSSN